MVKKVSISCFNICFLNAVNYIEVQMYLFGTNGLKRALDRASILPTCNRHVTFILPDLSKGILVSSSLADWPPLAEICSEMAGWQIRQINGMRWLVRQQGRRVWQMKPDCVFVLQDMKSSRQSESWSQTASLSCKALKSSRHSDIWSRLFSILQVTTHGIRQSR